MEKRCYKEDSYEIIEYIYGLNYHTIKISHQYDFSSIVYNGRKKNNVKKAKIILPLFE